MIPQTEPRWRAKAHQTLAMIALARHDAATARREAQRATEINPKQPLRDYVDGLIEYNALRFSAAVPLFRKALDDNAVSPVALPELRYYLGDALARLGNYSEAEPVLLDEVRLFPHDLRARAGLAMLYHATGRDAASDNAVAAIVRAAPTPEGYALASKLWTMFGQPEKARALESRVVK